MAEMPLVFKSLALMWVICGFVVWFNVLLIVLTNT